MIVAINTDEIAQQLSAQIAHHQQQIERLRAQLDLIVAIRENAQPIEGNPDASNPALPGLAEPAAE